MTKAELLKQKEILSKNIISLKKENDKLASLSAKLRANNASLNNNLEDVRDMFNQQLKRANKLEADLSDLNNKNKSLLDLSRRLSDGQKELLNELERLKSNWFVKLWMK